MRPTYTLLLVLDNKSDSLKLPLGCLFCFNGPTASQPFKFALVTWANDGLLTWFALEVKRGTVTYVILGLLAFYNMEIESREGFILTLEHDSKLKVSTSEKCVSKL